MKNIKCLLGHNLHLMKLNDVIKHQYENDKENITVYKCKYCGKIITGKTDSIKPSFKKIEEKKKKDEVDVRVREYEGWSIINIENAINILGNEDVGYIHLISKNEIESEVEKLGLVQIIYDCFKRDKGLDLNVEVFKSKYNKEGDSISGSCNHRISTNKTSSEFKYCDFKLEEAEDIITIKYKIINKRYNKSKWWRFWNKRKYIIKNDLY